MRKKATPTESDTTRAPTFLRQWRKFRKLSQAKASEAMGIGVEQGTLSKYERGLLPYNQDVLERAARAYGCEPHELLAIDPTKPDPPKVVYLKLRNAPPGLQRQALSVIEALLEAS